MRSEEEQMVEKIMDTDTMGYAYVYPRGNGEREEYLVVIQQIKRCFISQIKTGISEYLARA